MCARARRGHTLIAIFRYAFFNLSSYQHPLSIVGSLSSERESALTSLDIGRLGLDAQEVVQLGILWRHLVIVVLLRVGSWIELCMRQCD